MTPKHRTRRIAAKPEEPRIEGEWFAPKRYGYGAGLPITWQGWLLVTGWLASLLGIAALLHDGTRGSELAGAVLGVVSTGIFIVLTASHTRGGWKWRWGQHD